MNRNRITANLALPDRHSFNDLAPGMLDAAASLALKDFKQTLFTQFANELDATLPPEIVARALNEAEALAALTPQPLLFLPALAGERVEAALRWWRRQQRVRDDDALSFAA